MIIIADISAHNIDNVKIQWFMNSFNPSSSFSNGNISSSNLQNENFYDTVSIDELKALVEGIEKEVTKKKIISQFKIKQFQSGPNKGKYYVKVDGKKHQSTTKEGLENIIWEKYSGQLPKAQTTFKALFYAFAEDELKLIQDEEQLVSSKNTQKKHIERFVKYIEDTKFANMQITAISKREVIELIEYNLSRYPFKRQAFVDFKTILNKTFLYAMRKDLITTNPLQCIDWTEYDKCFISSTPINERGYTDAQIIAMVQLTQKYQRENPSYSKYWSYEFNILTGTRRAEIPPLKWSDVHWQEGHIVIHQQEVGSAPYQIKNVTKTKKIRYFPITGYLREFLIRLMENNAKYHPNSEFLFPDEETALGCITPNVTYRVHKKICKELGITISCEIPKGTHAFRRSHQTSFINEGGSLDLASAAYGNSPKVVEDHYYLGANAKLSAPIISIIQEKFMPKKEVNYSERTFL